MTPKSQVPCLAMIALLSATVTAAAASQPQAPRAGSHAAAISDRELLAAASLVPGWMEQKQRAIDDRELFESAWLASLGFAPKGAMLTVLKSGEAGEAPEAPELDGPGGSTHDFQGEEAGEH
jgi:hypothetical protein